MVMSFTIRQAATAPEKYDIQVHRKDSRQLVMRLRPFRRAPTVLTRLELNTYCKSASDSAASIKRLESTARSCGSPNTNVITELEMKIERLIAPALNGATFLRFGD